MKINFITEDGHRLDEGGGREFPTKEHAARDALRALSDWLIDQGLKDLPSTYGVIGLDEQGVPLFRLYMTVGMDDYPKSEPMP